MVRYSFFPLMDALTFDQYMPFMSEMFNGFSYLALACYSILTNENQSQVEWDHQQIIPFWKIYYLWLSPQGEIFKALIFGILKAKYYIHNKILLYENNIEFLHFLYVLKFKLNIEHNIYKTNNTTQTFNKFVFLCDQMCYQHILFMK